MSYSFHQDFYEGLIKKKKGDFIERINQHAEREWNHNALFHSI